MPRYPRDPKPWLKTVYGGNKPRWDEAKAQCRETLLEWAKDRKPGTYTDLIRHVPAIDWPDGAHTHSGRQIGMLLGQVAVEELDELEDRPLLSALVFGQESNRPGQGYWDLMTELGVAVPDSDDAQDRLWWAELDRVYATFGVGD
jgi:hypothetical protein